MSASDKSVVSTAGRRIVPAMLKRADGSLMEYTGMSYTTIYNMEKAGKFPARRRLSPGRVGWIKEEVDAWLSSLEEMSQANQVTVLNDNGTTSVITMDDARRLDTEVQGACKRERLYRPCGDLCGSRPCPPGSSYICYESTDTFACACTFKGRCTCKQEALDEFERVHGDAYHDYTKCDGRGVPAERGFYLPPYNHLKPADFRE